MKTGLALIAALTPLAFAAPAPQPVAAPVPQSLGDLTNGVIGGLNDAFQKGDLAGVLKGLTSVKPTAQRPKTVEEARKRIVDLNTNNRPTNIYEYSSRLTANSLISGTLASLISGIAGQFGGRNSNMNRNPNPPVPVYPKRLRCDAPYTIPENKLRSAIHIPPTFTRGRKPPVILFPGTGVTGFQTYAGNYIKLLTNKQWADPVWVNVPGSLLDDAQANAQYAAYALNYIASLTGRNATIIAWSQGNIDAQWAYKYWPSTRLITSDHIAVSADYAGTLLTNFVCPPGFPSCAPAVFQQEYLRDSNFITALRSNGGDSGYVPTTSIYSGLLDQIVQPQSGTTASAFLKDARGVGVENVEVQKACKTGLAGSLYTHESLLVNPLVLALTRDAMANPGPGRLSRLQNLPALCAPYVAPGLGVGDLLVTEQAFVIAAVNLLTHKNRVSAEPRVQAFANAAPATCRA